MLLPAALLTAVDAGATTLWLRLGVAMEGNPWLHDLLTGWGAHQAMLTRATVGLVLLSVLALLLEHGVTASYGLAVVTGVLGGVCAWHGLGALLLVSRVAA